MSEGNSPFSIRDGRKVVIILDEGGHEISVKDTDGKDIGSIKLDCIEFDHGDRYKITWMYLDKQEGAYLHQGIGRECLRLHKEAFDAPIEASDNDGIRKPDGSHLTGDAPGFVSKMREEGFVIRSFDDYSGEEE